MTILALLVSADWKRLGFNVHPKCSSCYDGRGCGSNCMEVEYCDGCDEVICLACHTEHNDLSDVEESELDDDD